VLLLSQKPVTVAQPPSLTINIVKHRSFKQRLGHAGQVVEQVFLQPALASPFSQFSLKPFQSPAPHLKPRRLRKNLPLEAANSIGVFFITAQRPCERTVASMKR